MLSSSDETSEFIKAQLNDWEARQYSEQSPQFVKEFLLVKHGFSDGAWIETGTFLGMTTAFLSERFSKVYTVEPGPKLYADAAKKFDGTNVEVINGLSEEVFPTLLPQLSGTVNFWLDGHYSEGVTFQGPQDCPVRDELAEIAKNLGNFDRLAVLIDDVRCFLPENDEYPTYPTVDWLLDWGRANGFNWRIEHDILIMKRSTT